MFGGRVAKRGNPAASDVCAALGSVAVRLADLRSAYRDFAQLHNVFAMPAWPHSLSANVDVDRINDTIEPCAMEVADRASEHTPDLGERAKRHANLLECRASPSLLYCTGLRA